MIYRKYGKRVFDIICSFLAIVVLSPVFLITWILVRIKLGSPALFCQPRVGKDEKVFTMFKFRTMTTDTDSKGNPLPDQLRMTKFGSVLRSTSIDELPELFNILKGDLSIVGPRPLLEDYLPYYKPEERLRHTVRGGLTQPEVLYGKVLPSWEEQFAYEVDYAKNVTFLLDLKIIFATVQILFKRVETGFGGTVRKPLNEERKKIAPGHDTTLMKL